MGLRAIFQQPRTTVPGDPSERFPCLVNLRLVTAVDQVWATDITYIPLQKEFLYLVAIVDLSSRSVLSWKLSNSLETEFCLDALEKALGGVCRPKIFDSDQGCHFTSYEFVGSAAWRGNQYQLVRPDTLLRQHPGGVVVENGQKRGGVPGRLQRWMGR